MKLYNKGKNDMPRGWSTKNNLNTRIYDLWHGMIRRCYSTNINDREKHHTYDNVDVCDDWLSLSNFVKDIESLPGYDKWKNSNIDREYELDKDILCEELGLENKIYSPSTCQFVTKSENSIQANKTRDYSSISGENSVLFGRKVTDEEREKLSKRMSGENSVWYGKKHTEETKEKMRKNAKKGEDNWWHQNRSGENHPCFGKHGEDHQASKKVIAVKISDGSITEYASIVEASEKLEILLNKKIDSSGITKVCKYNHDPEKYMENHKNARKSVAGYTFYYKDDYKGDVK